MPTVDFTLEQLLTATAKQAREITQEIVDKAVDRLDTRIDRLETKLDRRFDSVEYRVDRLEGRIDDVDEHLSAHARATEQAYAAVDKRMSRLEQGRA